MQREEIIERINELGQRQPWNHSIELIEGVFTCSPNQSSPAKNLIKWERMRHFFEAFPMKGKRVLDVGCSDGFFSLKTAEYGAQVVALESNPERIEKARFVFEAKQISDRVKLVEMNIHDAAVEGLGYFDMILCLGFIHRVPDPYTVLSKLVNMTDALFLEFKAFEEYAYDRPYLMFDGRRSDPEDPLSTCYFIPSLRTVLAMLRHLGLEHYGIIGDPKSRRAMIVVSKKELAVFRELRTLERVSLLYLLRKFIRRFGADIFKAFRGDFEKR